MPSSGTPDDAQTRGSLIKKRQDVTPAALATGSHPSCEMNEKCSKTIATIKGGATGNLGQTDRRDDARRGRWFSHRATGGI